MEPFDYDGLNVPPSTEDVEWESLEDFDNMDDYDDFD